MNDAAALALPILNDYDYKCFVPLTADVVDKFQLVNDLHR